LPKTGVRLCNLSNDWGCIAIFGPHARDALAQLTHEDVSNQALPFMAARWMDMGMAPALVARLSVTGELGYEIHLPQVYLSAIYDRLRAASVPISDCGMYALLSLRMEKGFGIWMREFSRDYTAMESGLARFVDYYKPDFIGRDAALRERETGPNRVLTLLEVEADDAEASPYEPVWMEQERVGFITSAAYGHTCQRSLALAYLPPLVAAGKGELEVTVIGERRSCRVLTAPPVDPKGLRMRE
jgi:dimethylglycine dehydrogenase